MSLSAQRRSAEALALAAVGRHGPGRGAVLDQVVIGEPLGELARLRVPQPDPVAEPQPGGRRAQHRGLHLTGALGSGELQPGRQVRRR